MSADRLIGGRERRLLALELKGVDEKGHFQGYASLFGEIDLGKDRVERGAFLRSLARRGASGVRMLFQHDPGQPIGAWQVIREDGRGLYVEGALTPGVARAGEVQRLMKSGALDGLSIGFKTVRAKSEPKTGIRTILEADLWEISIVTFPMLPGARVAEVKTDPADEARFLALLGRGTKMLAGAARQTRVGVG